MKMKALLLTVGSFALTAGVIGNAYLQKKQFYPSVVFITKSSPSMAVSVEHYFDSDISVQNAIFQKSRTWSIVQL